MWKYSETKKAKKVLGGFIFSVSSLKFDISLSSLRPSSVAELSSFQSDDLHFGDSGSVSLPRSDFLELFLI